MHDRHQQLVRLIEEQAGESFRSAFSYDAEGWTALYVRTDLATRDLEAVVPSLAKRARDHEPLIRQLDYPGLGEQRASISLHDDAVLVQFHDGDRSGVVITLDNDVAQDLSEFVAECEAVLTESD
mgnify:CR=1 FL=1